MAKTNPSIFGAAFLDGFSLAGFLTPLLRPGAPTRVFDDNCAFIDDEQETLANSVQVEPDEIDKAMRTLAKAGFDPPSRKTNPVH